MAAWGTVWKKEVKENFRDWRAIMPALIIGPILSPLLMGAMFTTILSQVAKDSEKMLELRVIGAEHAPNLMKFLGAHRVNVIEGPKTRDEAIIAVQERKAESVLLVHSSMGEHIAAGTTATVELIHDESRRSSSIESIRVSRLVEAYGTQMGSLRLLARGVDPQIMRPLNVDRVDVSTPSGRSVMLLGIVSYLILFAVLMGGLTITSDSTAGERERKSLEPLLTVPISRTQLVLEKIAAAALFMLLALAIVLTTLFIGLRYIPLEQVDMRSDFGLPQVLTAFVILAPFAFLGAGVMSVVASFTKTYKEAQTYLGFMIAVPTLPIVFAGIADLKPELSMMAVPSLSHHFLLQALLKAEPLNWLHVAVSIGSTSLLAAVAITVATRLYRREGVLG